MEQQDQSVIPPHPIPTTFQIAQTTFGGKNFVAFIVFTGAGQNIFFMEPIIAKQIGELLAKSGITAETGLVLPV